MTEQSPPSKAELVLTVNGEERRLAEQTRLAQLIDDLGFSGQRIAAEVNYEVVPKSKHAEHILCAGDRVEIVCFVGGG